MDNNFIIIFSCIGVLFICFIVSIVVSITSKSGAVDESLQKIYQIGSVYITFNETNPSEILGFGTWELIENRFLYCSKSTAGRVGGNSTVKLTEKELPPHSHEFDGETQYGTIRGIMSNGDYEGTGIFERTYHNPNNRLGGFTNKRNQNDYSITVTPSGTIDNTGEGKSFSIMPPYITVYAWQRIE